jgi:error-prone DNA polymerase
MSCLPRLRPANFYDIVVQVAIIRPGPIVGNMVHPYLKRRQGTEEVFYAHPDLEPILKRTLGVPLFQEQLLRMAMVCAGFTGGEAEELRRAFGFKRSEARMKAIEGKLRAGLAKKGIHGKTQDEIVLSISSFALYGFPESHAASFALLAYASAYLKCNYLAAFTAAMLNNQPMGFYQPFTLIKDAQRHGLKVLPIDITCSDWPCTLEATLGEGARLEEGEKADGDWVTWGVGPVSDRDVSSSPNLAMRLGLRYVKGLSEQSGRAIVRERAAGPFTGINDLRRRVPELRKDELRKLAAVGALNFMHSSSINRRDALWQVERVARTPGKLYEQLIEKDSNSPLEPMTLTERVDADFRGTGLTIGKHPVAYHRKKLNRLKALRAIDIRQLRDGNFVRVAGWVIVRQRPGTAKGFMFLSLEDETGVSNIIVTPQLFDRYRRELVGHPFLLIEGKLQNQDNVISVKASHIQPLAFKVAGAPSHDFH